MIHGASQPFGGTTLRASERPGCATSPLGERSFRVSSSSDEAPVEDGDLELDLEFVRESCECPCPEGRGGQGPRSLASAPDFAGLEHRSRTIDEEAHAVRATIREIPSFEHALVQAGAEEERCVRREVTGIEPGAQATPLVGEEERVELAGDSALSDTPFLSCHLEQVAALGCEAAELDGEVADDQLPCLAGRQEDRRSRRHLHQLIGGRVTGLIGLAMSSVFSRNGLCRLPCLLVSVAIGQRRGNDPYRIDALGDGHLVCGHLRFAADGRISRSPLREETVHAGNLDELQRNTTDGPRIIQLGNGIEEGHSIVESESDMWFDTTLEFVALEVVTDDEETCEGELTERPGIGRRPGHRRPVEVGEHGSGTGERSEVTLLLPGVLEGEEHRFGGRTSDRVERVEKGHGSTGRRRLGLGFEEIVEGMMLDVIDDFSLGFDPVV